MATDLDIRQGGCLCGAVTVAAVLPQPDIHLCHCGQCQRWTGGGPLSVIRAVDIKMKGDDAIGRYHASGHGERGFCKVCGTTLFWKMQGKPLGFVPVGLLDDQSGLRVTEEIFVDRRACWLEAHAGASQQDEAEMMAALDAYLAKEAGA